MSSGERRDGRETADRAGQLQCGVQEDWTQSQGERGREWIEKANRHSKTTINLASEAKERTKMGGQSDINHIQSHP